MFFNQNEIKLEINNKEKNFLMFGDLKILF